MSKFNRVNTRPNVTSAVQTAAVSTARTHQGGPGYARDAKSELFILAVSNMVSEGTFYESGNARDDRYAQLVRQVAVEDLDWTTKFLAWLRDEANMRSASLVGALEAVHARLSAKAHGGNRQLVASVLRRADEPGEALAYWTATFGRPIPSAVDRGINDAVLSLYNERNLIKYDTASHGFRFADVIELTRAKPSAAWQSDLFKYAIDRRHNREFAASDALSMIHRNRALLAMPVNERRKLLETQGAEFATTLREAGMTWEGLAGWLQGPMDAKAWEAIIPSMGYMALLRNLRNFDEAGISAETASFVMNKLANPEEVARSRQFPFRFLSAYRNSHVRWHGALETAIQLSLSNVPALDGTTLILVDQSGSMFTPISNKSTVLQSEQAAVFGAALALRGEKVDLVQYGSGSALVNFRRGDALLQIANRFTSMGGTNTAEAVNRHYNNHSRVILVTDEQAGSYYYKDPFTQIPQNVPTYTWNLVGYKHGHAPSGANNRHTFGGMTDNAFKMIPLLESTKRAGWPWEH
ncbi:MAG TPA: TROVE domain-containing protein [Gammaproteobacteria bacterium]|nr:TROVE domain-containing protein [Gammaproteobacteria bacterium]